MLPKLRDLDPRKGRQDARPCGEGQPCFLGLDVATEPTQQSASFRDDSRLRPGSVLPSRLDRRPGGRDWMGPGATAEIRRPTGRPPRLVVRPPHVGWLGPAGRLGSVVGSTKADDRSIQAGQRLLVPALLHEGPGEAGQVARWRVRPAPAVAVVAIDADEQTGQRTNVLVVVLHDRDEWPRLAVAEELEVAARDLPTGDVPSAPYAEELGLDRRQPGIAEAMPKDPPDEGQEVQVAGV
jgi:hypothetical protein